MHWEEVCKIAAQVLTAVKYMHERGCIHGDVKPLNLMRFEDAWKLIDLDAATVIGQVRST